MARETSQSLRHAVIYEVYVRNHSQEGTFKGLEKDLTRIKSLGVDIIWLMPIHPIGKDGRKGSLGCPYSILDYREINPEYGSIEDFMSLVNSVHQQGMLLMIDIVFNHTSQDSWLYKHHPEWFYRNARGEISGKVPDWMDVIDLDYSHPELWSYQIETLTYWASKGVDGFRCDVAPVVPIDFWMKAREELTQINPNFIWLAESSDPSFIQSLRKQNFTIHSDSEMYQAFDITYDYDVYHTFRAYLEGYAPLEEYLSLLRLQETNLPGNYLKLRFVENHDQPRIRAMTPFENTIRQWTAFSFFQKGTALIHGGQETNNPRLPSLFEKEAIDWSLLNPDYTVFLRHLSAIKKESLIGQGYYQIHESLIFGVILVSYRKEERILYGIFNVEGKCGSIRVDCKDGSYRNIIDGKELMVRNGLTDLSAEPVIFYGEIRKTATKIGPI